jgi:hypothetical protein
MLTDNIKYMDPYKDEQKQNPSNGEVFLRSTEKKKKTR